jgi:hypothetical protein
MKRNYFLFLLLAIALLIRVAFIPNPGFEADVSFWKGWGLAAADKGAVWSMLNTNNNYPTPFSYQLGAMVIIYRFLGGNPWNFNDYWSNNNTKFLLASKLWPIVADFAIAGLFIFIGKRRKQLGFIPVEEDTSPVKRFVPKILRPLLKEEHLFTFLAFAYLFNPVSIMDGAWWGQVDSVGVIFFLLAILAVLYKKPYIAGVIFMFSMMTKLQNMIYGPLLFAYIWQIFGLPGLLLSGAGAVTGFFGFNIEFLLSHNMNRVIGSLVNNYDYFPWMSLHAYNPWWIAAKGNGMQVSDKLLTIGITTAQKLGTALFSASYLIALLTVIQTTFLGMLFPKKKKLQTEQGTITPESIYHLFLGLSIVNAGFFLFQTESHERYAFPLSVFLLFLMPFLSQKRRIIFFIAYVLWSILYFFNLHCAFAVNYPLDVIQFLIPYAKPGPTMMVGAILTLTFFAFIFFFAKQIKTLPFLAASALVIGMIGMGNLSFFLGKPIRLSDLKPIATFQGFGQRMKDMPVNASYGPKSWTFLSDNYAFFRHGIGTHAISEIRYDIGGKFKTFETDYGVDTEAGTAASVVFEIWGDGKSLFVSEKMGRFDMPKHATVSIVGVKTLTLIVRDGGDGNRDDHADWLNPILYQ